MPHPYKGHTEIFRTLKPGGKHVFTVPFDASALMDDVRAELNGGKIKYIKSPIYHADLLRPNGGILVWHIFGQEMIKKLQTIGFHVDVKSLHIPDEGILGGDAIVFVAKKSEEDRRGGRLNSVV